MDYAEEQRQRWNAGRVREHDWAARSAPRAPTGLEQHTPRCSPVRTCRLP